MDQLFLQASRLKLRFDYGKNQITTEQLWSLSLPELNQIAIGVNAEIKESSTESFIDEKPKANTEATVKLEVLKAIIKIKKEEDAIRASKVVKQQKRAQLIQALSKKQSEAVDNLSIEELNAQLDALDEE